MSTYKFAIINFVVLTIYLKYFKLQYTFRRFTDDSEYRPADMDIAIIVIRL